MRRWVGLVVVAQLAFACQQGGSPDDGDAGPQQIITDAGVDAGHPDGGDGGTDAGFDAGVHHPDWPPARPGYVNPIPPENQRQGDASWNRGFTKPDASQLEAYADRVSAKAGDSVNLMVRSSRSGCNGNWTLYRIGWYGGAGARALASGSSPINAQPSCPVDPVTKLVRCRWSPTFSVGIPADAVSGLYLVRIIDDRDRYGVMIPLVV
ncbi:MAG: N,N-dimethylformamidase beta subunit family domain-containing protein, partial [Myxococcales bacterium]